MFFLRSEKSNYLISSEVLHFYLLAVLFALSFVRSSGIHYHLTIYLLQIYSEHFHLWMLHISVISHCQSSPVPVPASALLLHSSDGDYFDKMSNPSWIDIKWQRRRRCRWWVGVEDDVQTEIIVFSQATHSGVQSRSNLRICPLALQYLLLLEKRKSLS